MRFSLLPVGLLLGLALGLSRANAPAQEAPVLKTAFKDHFLIGVALNQGQFTERDAEVTQLITRQFNTITPENVLKWGAIHPRPGQFAFGPADRYVEFGERHGMFIIGHNLVWHSQTPGWVFEQDGQPASREVLLQRMHEHIAAVVGRYKGRVKGWDVVNEALEGDGSLRRSPWRNIIGEDFLQKAFEFAHEADPAAELYYNDYGLENEPKRKGAIALVKRLKAAGVRIDGIGVQEHVSLNWPSAAQLDDTLTAFGKLGIKTMVTELDVDVLPSHDRTGSADVGRREAADVSRNPYTNGLPERVQKALSNRYAELFSIYLKHSPTLSRVTFWGVRDGDSWLNNFPIHGRTAYPLLFDRQGKPKPCFDAVIHTVDHRGSDGASVPQP